MKIPQKILDCLLSLLLAIMPAGCSEKNPTNSSAAKADIVLTGTNEEVARQLVGQYDRLAALAKEPGKSVQIMVAGTSADPVIVKLAFNREGQPILTKPDGSEARLELGWDGLKPVIRLVNPESGDVVGEQVIAGKVAAKIVRAEQVSPAEWVQAGIVAAGAAIIAWLGLKAIELTIVGIGYLAMVALVVSAAIIASGVVTKIFNTLGWTADDLIDLFRQSFSDLADIIAGAIQKFQETYNLG